MFETHPPETAHPTPSRVDIRSAIKGVMSAESNEKHHSVPTTEHSPQQPDTELDQGVAKTLEQLDFVSVASAGQYGFSSRKEDTEFKVEKARAFESQGKRPEPIFAEAFPEYFDAFANSDNTKFEFGDFIALVYTSSEHTGVVMLHGKLSKDMYSRPTKVTCNLVFGSSAAAIEFVARLKNMDPNAQSYFMQRVLDTGLQSRLDTGRDKVKPFGAALNLLEARHAKIENRQLVTETI